MAQKKYLNSKKNSPLFPPNTFPKVLAVIFLTLALVFVLSFIEKAGIGGRYLKSFGFFLLGQGVLTLPFILILAGLVLLKSEYHKFLRTIILAIVLMLVGSAGFLSSQNPELRLGGMLGYLFSWPIFTLFGFLVTKIIFGVAILIALLIFWQMIKPSLQDLLTKKVLSKEQLQKDRKLQEPAIVKVQPPTKKPSLLVKLKSGFAKPPPKIKEHPSQVQREKKLVYPLSLLSQEYKSVEVGDIEANKKIIQSTLENFGIQVQMGEVNIGPTVAQYTLKPAEGIKLSRITALANNLALALAAHPLRIEAPIPGKSLVGIEVPNKTRAEVKLGSMLCLDSFQRSGPLTFTLGQDVSGKPVFADLAKMPHLLVAGSTGSGKTIFLNSLILSLLQKNTPETLRFILIDPKRVELQIYEGIPHLLGQVVVEPEKTIFAIRWLIKEMEDRFRLLSQTGARDIYSYNEKIKLKSRFKSSQEELLPYIVFIIDELADLMVSRGKELEAGIVRLAQMARAVGIHLVLATQRPSVEVLTGLIKANITSRLALKVATQVDSRTILDISGAEKLLGAGDALFISTTNPQPRRVQTPYISEKEVKAVVNWLKNQPQLYEFNNLKISFEEALEEGVSQFSLGSFGGEVGTDDELYQQAKEIVLRAKKASASLLQRRLKIGYARAARLLDMLEEAGIVGPQEGSKPRKVYYDKLEEIEPTEI